MSAQNKSTVMLVISMAVFGTIGVFVRNVPLASGEIALYRAVMAALFIGLYLLVTGQRIPFKKIKGELITVAFSGVAMAFNWILLFESYKYTTVSIATLSYYFAPVIVTVACPFIFKEKMGAKQWICFAMSTLGIVLITGIGDMSAGSSHIIGILFGLGAAALYATVILLNKSMKTVDGIHRTFLQFVAAVAVLVPYVLLTSGVNIGELNLTGGVNLVIIGILHTGICYCLYFSSLKELSGQKAAILSYTDPLVAVLVSVIFLRESMSIFQIIGGCLILGFTIWNEIPPKNKKGLSDSVKPKKSENE